MKEDIMGFLFAAVVVSLFIHNYYFSKTATIKRKLKKAKYKSLSTFKDGDIAKVLGTIEFTEAPIIAPISRRKCAYYNLHVERNRKPNKQSYWETLINEKFWNKYLIKEGEHYAYIHEVNRLDYVVQDKHYQTGMLNDPSPKLKKFLNDRGIDYTGSFGFNRSLRFNEGVLEENEMVAAFGKGKWRDATDFGFDAKYGKILVLRAAKDIPVYLSDSASTTGNQLYKQITKEWLKATKQSIVKEKSIKETAPPKAKEKPSRYKKHYRK